MKKFGLESVSTLTLIGQGMLMIERVLQGFVSMWEIILSLGWVKSRTPSLYLLLKLSTLLPVAVAPNSYGCKNSSMIMVFVNSILQSIVTILVPLISLRIRFNILEPNTYRFDITSLGSLSKMVLLLLSLFTLMIRRLIYLPNLLTTNGLNSFSKTLVSSPWIDLSFSSFFLMHLHLVLCIALFNMFLFVYFSILFYFVFHIKLKIKN